VDLDAYMLATLGARVRRGNWLWPAVVVTVLVPETLAGSGNEPSTTSTRPTGRTRLRGHWCRRTKAPV